MTEFLIYDVFTEKVFGGNPLAIIPDAQGLPEEALQKIAREFNFSETTFVYPPRNKMSDARVRIFTPTRELNFAGHPTVGTAVALVARGQVGRVMALEFGVGPLQVSVDGSYARFVTRVPLQASAAPDAAALAACLSLEAAQIRVDRHEPVTAGLGTDFVLVELADAEALDAASPDLDACRKASGEDGRIAVFCYVRDGAGIKARMFAPLGGILEDPATGSASAALAAYLGRLEGQSAVFDIDQGVAMGRPSKITAEVTVEAGEPVAVAISGHAVKVMEGRLTL